MAWYACSSRISLTTFLLSTKLLVVNPKKPIPTEQELEILKIIWRRGSATVREVYEEILQHRKIAYTTTMTMMGILEQKGHVTRKEKDRAYVYSPAEPQKKVMRGMVNDFVSRVFDGSAKPLMMHLIENQKLPAEELEEIAKLLAERRKQP